MVTIDRPNDLGDYTRRRRRHATQLSSWVASAVWTHPSAVVTQFTIFCPIELEFGDKWRRNDVKVEKVTNRPIDQNSRSQTAMFSFQTVDRIRRQSSWASCELCSHRRRNATRQSSRVASAVCIGLRRRKKDHTTAAKQNRLNIGQWRIYNLKGAGRGTFQVYIYKTVRNLAHFSH